MTRERAARECHVATAVGGLFVTALALGVSSCDAIEPRPLTKAPLNACPCDKYEPGTTAAKCVRRPAIGERCEISTPGGRPEFPFWIVVHVPDTSFTAPGFTYVLYSDAQGNPAFKEPAAAPGVIARCRPPDCLPIGGVADATVRYKVSHLTSVAVGYPLTEGTSIPVRVVYEPSGNDQQGQFPLLPLDALFGSSQLAEVAGGGPSNVVFRRVLPAGRYHRVLYPQPPFDEFFPPSTVLNQEIAAGTFLDDFVLGDTSLDDVDLRTVGIIEREDGLDGWRTWLVDRPSQRRISVVRTLFRDGVVPAGESSHDHSRATKVRLYTTNERRSPTGGLGDDVEAIVAPPSSWTGVPRLVTPLFSGGGLDVLRYPRIPPPATVTGVVVQPGDGGVLLGYAAVVSFESEALATTTDPSTLLEYSTTVNTDDRGRFATVLPPGRYLATIEPAEGTGYAKRKEEVLVDRSVTALTFQPPLRTLVKGRALLTDGRPLGDADVIAIPDVERSVPPDPLFTPPRPSRTRTGDDGRFAFELDAGPYVLSVIPKTGTGFPRVVVRPEVPGSLTAKETVLPDVRVPAPTRLAFKLRDPSQTGNPIKDAVVRIFAMPAGAPTAAPIEIGSTMTNALGEVEILLAQQPR